MANFGGTPGDDIYSGSGSDESMAGYDGDDLLEGAGGNDSLNGGIGNDTLDGGAGDDRVIGMSGDDLLIGGSGNDTLEAGLGSNNLGGGDGDDQILSYGGADTLDGGAGDDQVTISGRLDGLVAHGGNGTDSLLLSAMFADIDHAYSIDGFEELEVNLSGTELADRIDLDVATDLTAVANSSFTLNGFGGDDVIADADGENGSLLNGGEGDDWLSGRGGNDTLVGGPGSDVLDGGAGKDTVNYTADFGLLQPAVYADLAAGVAREIAGSAVDRLIGIENVIGSYFNDVLKGDGDDNFIEGHGGDDTLVGGLGDDTLMGDGGYDIASYLDADAAVAVDLRVTARQDTGGSGVDTLVDIEGVRGGAFDDVLRGNASANLIDAAQGNDLILGYGGADTLVGGDGRDKVYGGDGIDRLHGNDGNDVAYGGADSDTIYGDAGNDVIAGEGGRDALFGGAGADLFIYADLSDSTVGVPGRDHIRDFSHAEGDRIDLSAIDAVTGVGDSAFAFIGGEAFTGVAGQLHVIATSTSWLVEGDVNGDKVADFAIQVTSATALVAADFVL